MTPSAQGVDDRVEVSRLVCEFDDMQQSESDLNQGDCVFCATGILEDDCVVVSAGVL